MRHMLQGAVAKMEYTIESWVTELSAWSPSSCLGVPRLPPSHCQTAQACVVHGAMPACTIAKGGSWNSPRLELQRRNEPMPQKLTSSSKEGRAKLGGTDSSLHWGHSQISVIAEPSHGGHLLQRGLARRSLGCRREAWHKERPQSS